MKPPKDDADGKTGVVARRVELNKPNGNLAAFQECQIGEVTLKDGKRVNKRAVALEVRDTHTNSHHHFTVTLETRRLQQIAGTWALDEKKAFTLDDETQISELVNFLSGLTEARERNIRGNVLVAPLDANADPRAVRQALKVLDTPERAGLVVDFLNAVGDDLHMLQFLTDTARSNPARLRAAATAINIGRFEAVLHELEQHIAQNANEAVFQRLLTANPWLFGSEYSARHERRNFVRDQQQDFMLRRTADGYLEIVEIKTPLNDEPLFRFDKDDNTWAPKGPLSAALAQVMNYLEHTDAHVHTVYARDNEDLTKVRARIIIGRNGTTDHLNALRRLNGHLHRVEVLTFDMLLRIGRRVVDALREPESDAVPEPEATVTSADDDDEIPF